MTCRGNDGSFSVVVAAWDPAFGYPDLRVCDGEQFSGQGPHVTYERRRKVAVVVTGETTLGTVIDEAAARFGVHSQNELTIAEQVHWVAFFREGDEPRLEYDYDRWYDVVRTVDADGRPSWALRWSEIRLSELVATAEAGYLAGDPLRPYFWPVIPQGDLAELAHALWALWTMWEHTLSARETVGLTRTLFDRARRGKAAAEEDFASWAQALGRPQDHLAYLDENPRTTAEAEQELRLSPAQAEGALWGMGYALGDDGRWRSAGDPASAELRADLLEIKQTGRALPSPSTPSGCGQS